MVNGKKISNMVDMSYNMIDCYVEDNKMKKI